MLRNEMRICNDHVSAIRVAASAGGQRRMVLALGQIVTRRRRLEATTT